jgi:hypothetical protein
VLAKILEWFNLDCAVRRRISDDEVGGLVLNRPLKLRPTQDWCERVL